MRLIFIAITLVWSLTATAEEIVAETDSSDYEPIKTKTREVQVIDPAELPEAMRNLPGLVEKIQVEQAIADSPYVLLPHRPNYVMPLTYQTKPDDKEWDRLISNVSDGKQRGQDGEFEHVEAVFQISVKFLLAEGIVGKYSNLEVAYTNRSFWQAYNDKLSKPFRETNHEPELILSWRPEHLSWLEHAGIALNHQSNGQTSSLSRSWNRVIFEGASIVGNGLWYMRTWWRIPEEEKGDPFDPSDNDNPDIDDYMGPGEVYYMHIAGKHHITAMVRNNFNFDDNRGAVQLEWSYPISKRFKAYTQYFNGYGESLIDYNRFQERFGVGILLTGWL